MFYINENDNLDAVLLNKMLNRFNVEVLPKLNNYKNYYDGLQKIINKSYSDETKPCNHTVINYCKNIVDSYCGYIATPGFISYKSNDDITDVMNILKYNDYQTEDSDLLLDSLVYGVGAELMFIDNEGKTRFRNINPRTCFGVFDDSLTGDLLYFVRFYKANDWDNSDTYNVDVYSNTSIKHYKMAGMAGLLTFVEEEPHYFSQCPANILTMPDEKSIFDCVISLQDAVNEILSDEIDDYSAFCDAYLAITGADLDAEDVATMKENRVLVLPEGATAQWLTKSASDTQVENILKRLHDSIYRVSNCPDFSSESFTGGVSSGIAIRYRLTGMETRSGKIEAVMKKALQRRVEIICGIASLKLGESVFRDIEITFKRNVPVDETSIVNTVTKLQGVVSNETLLSQIPFVTDINAEMEALEQQKAEELALYSFDEKDEGNE